MSPHLSAVLQALFVVFLWATSWVFIKIGLQEIPPLFFAGLRYILAFFLLLLWLLTTSAWREIKTLPKGKLAGLFILGLLYYAVTQGAIFFALAYLPAVTVNLLWNLSSIIVTWLGIRWLSEKPTLLQWIGTVIALLGVIIYFSPMSIPKAHLVGVIAALIGILANSVSSILGRNINRSALISPLLVTMISMGIGSIVLMTTGVIVEGIPVISMRNWLIIGWLAIVNTAFAFTLWNHTLRTLTAMESSIINGTMLIWITILAVLFLGEKITGKEILGLIAVGVGSLLVQIRRIRKFRSQMNFGGSAND